MSSASNRNDYLDQVVQQQQQLEIDLRAPSSKLAAPGSVPPSPGQAPTRRRGRGLPAIGAPPSTGVDVRITGFWRWRTVLVPPNAFVVHTRRGRAEPLHVGLGMSFRYNPATDAFLVVPGAMQTILINAYCICRELQGVVVQAYVQWIIQDFRTAYRKLDFSNPEDPMRLVNLQLKEQAEAAIKDKVATMGMADVLSDKQPIIEELTARLRAVAEGQGDSDTGLGLRIVTVQIKEAVVSSAQLWENLQKPYRSDQGRLARLAELAAEEVIHGRELAAARLQETQQIESQRELGDLRAAHEAARFDRDSAEQLRRAQREQEDAQRLAELESETTLHNLRLERERHAEETEMARMRAVEEHTLARLRLEGELALARSRRESAHEEALLALEQERIRTVIANDQSPANLQAQLVDALPEIVHRLPKPKELKSVTIGGTDQSTLSGLLTEIAAIVGTVRAASSQGSDSRTS